MKIIDQRGNINFHFPTKRLFSFSRQEETKIEAIRLFELAVQANTYHLMFELSMLAWVFLEEQILTPDTEESLWTFLHGFYLPTKFTI